MWIAPGNPDFGSFWLFSWNRDPSFSIANNPLTSRKKNQSNLMNQFIGKLKVTLYKMDDQKSKTKLIYVLISNLQIIIFLKNTGISKSLGAWVLISIFAKLNMSLYFHAKSLIQKGISVHSSPLYYPLILTSMILPKN